MGRGSQKVLVEDDCLTASVCLTVRVSIAPSEAPGTLVLSPPPLLTAPWDSPRKSRSPLTQKPLRLPGNCAQGDPWENFLEEPRLQTKLRNVWEKIPHPVAKKWRNFGEAERTAARMKLIRPPPSLSCSDLCFPLGPNGKFTGEGFWQRVLVAWSYGSLGERRGSSEAQPSFPGGPPTARPGQPLGPRLPAAWPWELPCVAPPRSILPLPDPSGCLGN